MKQFRTWIGGFVLLTVLIGIVLPSSAHFERDILIDAHAKSGLLTYIYYPVLNSH